ncbi:hypothetical protein APSETT445_008528 [Aspergillus pseudonomiae]
MVWLVQFVALLTLTLAALATSITLLLKTLGFKNERNGALCYNKSGGRYRCRSARSQTHFNAGAQVIKDVDFARTADDPKSTFDIRNAMQKAMQTDVRVFRTQESLDEGVASL